MVTDHKGVKKENISDVYRIGRVFSIEKNKIDIDKKLFMQCVEPGYCKSVITSHVKDVCIADDGLIITTENSIYFLVEKEIAERYEGTDCLSIFL